MDEGLLRQSGLDCRRAFPPALRAGRRNHTDRRNLGALAPTDELKGRRRPRSPGCDVRRRPVSWIASRTSSHIMKLRHAVLPMFGTLLVAACATTPAPTPYVV